MGQQFFKKIYSPGEFYTALHLALSTAGSMRKSRKKGELSAEFMERIMLAVTEVNGCEVCSYFHTKVALESGISAQEIESLLSGSGETVPKDEALAVIFAQHYADTRGNPSEKAWDRVVNQYGLQGALGILGAIRMIMIGNIYGIALSAIRRRLKGKPEQKSSLLYEVGMLFSIFVFLPTAAIHALVSGILKKPLITFDNENTSVPPEQQLVG